MTPLLLFILLSPIQELVNVELLLPSPDPAIFCDYGNDNFHQRLQPTAQGLKISIVADTNYYEKLSFRLVPDPVYAAAQDGRVREICEHLLQQDPYLGPFLKNLNLYLRSHIRYDSEEIAQDVPAVLENRRANCVGFSNLAQGLLGCAGIHSRFAKGFFLENRRGELSPVAHRWLEVEIDGQRRFFFDPQYPGFASAYIVVQEEVSFPQVEKFKGFLIQQIKRVSN